MFYPITITLGGLHGTGKTTYARAIADEFDLRHISAGKIFRRLAEEKKLSLHEFALNASVNSSIDHSIDNIIQQELERGCVVVEGQLAAWMASDKVDIKIYLTASNNIRFKRIAKREKLLYQEAEQETRDREESERRRFQEIYDINMMDLSIYDLVIDTSLLPLDDTITMLKNIISNYIQKKKRRKK